MKPQLHLMESWKLYEQLRYDWYFHVLLACLLTKGTIMVGYGGLFFNLGVLISHYQKEYKRLRDLLIVNAIALPIGGALAYYAIKNFYTAYNISCQMSALRY